MGFKILTVNPLIALMGLLVYGCGYLASSQPFRSDEAHLRKIAVPIFVNDTLEPALEAKLTRLIKQEFLTHRGVRIASDPVQADWVVEGRITDFSETTLSLNPVFRADKNQTEYQAAENRISLSVDIRVLDPQERVVLWQQGGIQGSAEYVVSPDPGVSRSAKDLAIDEAAKRIAEEIWNHVSRLKIGEPSQNRSE